MDRIQTFVKQGAVYAPVGKHMICIGSEEDVNGATPQELCEMIYSARRIAEYLMIASGRNRVLH